MAKIAMASQHILGFQVVATIGFEKYAPGPENKAKMLENIAHAGA